MNHLGERITLVLEGLNRSERNNWKCEHIEPPQWHSRGRKKYIALDCGTSGAFLVEKETGELFNIKAYGSPDRNKKKKADIGNIFTADPAILWRKRRNYLR